jgi:hypothetical protein
MKRTFKESTWNYIIVALLALLALYLTMPSALAEGLEDLTVQEADELIGMCTAAYAIVGYELDDKDYQAEGTRWAEFYIGFKDNDGVAARASVKSYVMDGLELMQSGERKLADFKEVADVNCVVIRDEFLRLLGKTVDNWYNQGE